MKSFLEKMQHEFVWLPEIGMGHFPVMPDNRPYDAAYFEKYQALADTEVGRDLTRARIQLVARHYQGALLDVGIGSGQFVESRNNTCGYDVNPTGIEWLERRGLWADLYGGRHKALSFWDSWSTLIVLILLLHALNTGFLSQSLFLIAGIMFCARNISKKQNISGTGRMMDLSTGSLSKVSNWRSTTKAKTD